MFVAVNLKYTSEFAMFIIHSVLFFREKRECSEDLAQAVFLGRAETLCFEISLMEKS